MRKITIDFNNIEPLESRILGYVGEHNATELTIIPPAEMTDNLQIKFFKLAFSVPYSVIYSENLHIGLLKGSAIRWRIPDSVTKHERVALQLEGYGENGGLLVKSQTVHGLRFFESVNSENDFEAVNSPIECGIEVTATDSDGNATELIIHGDLPKGITVNNSNLEKITLHGMTEIPDSLCENCAALREVEINRSVTAIGSYAFKKCTALRTLSLPSGIKTIGSEAFSGCTALEEVDLPESLNYVGYKAFGETGLVKVTVPSSADNWGNYVFSGSNLKEAVIGEGITALPIYTFQRCSELKSVTLPSTLTSLRDSTFVSCSSLESIRIPEGVDVIERNVFKDCKKLCEVSLGNVKNIGDSVFYGCSNLKRITLPEDLLSIGTYAFSYCGFSEIVIPDSVTSIGDNAFYFCGDLSSIKLSKNITSLPNHIFGRTALTEFDVSDNIESIGQHAFSYCPSLKRVTIGSGVNYIKSYAFYSCKALEYVRIKRTSPPTLAAYDAFPYSSSTFIGIYVPKSENEAVLSEYKTATNWKSSFLVDKIFEWEGEE